MSKPYNPLAGIADPYWYEWSVGEKYLIDMLNQDSEIESVTLQATGVQGLDDVIVKRTSGLTECIQIKHTRSYDSITFGNLVTGSKNKKSLLQSISEAWEEAKSNWNQCVPILFTNRESGDRTVTVRNEQKEEYKRPALSEFWPYLQTQLSSATTLKDISMCQEWTKAWKEWCAQLDTLSNDSRKIEFLKSLRIETNQPNLEEITGELVQKLALTFGISLEKARPLLSLLDHALREWATSLRRRESIDREDVYKVLSIPAQELIGDHSLVPPEPFFPSRKEFVDKLSNELIFGKNPIIFLSGLPGIGKTSIVSALANRREPVIDLRYHAFKPITPNNAVVAADSGITTKADVLWGDLLSQFRTIFEGRLAHYNVPIRNEYLTVEQMRENVLRLAEIYAIERDRPTIIAIDGIDHAARAGIDKFTFLETLLPPEGVPRKVRFLIVGQPLEAYEKYPRWLKEKSDTISFWNVEGINTEDITSLLSSTINNIPDDEFDAAVRYIESIAEGNTLAAIFAVNETQDCISVQELQLRLENRKLTSGISTYYDSIWTSAIEPFKGAYPFVGYRLAGCLSLISERITGEMLSKIFLEMSIPETEWTNVLRALRPLVVEESEGFRVTHNDVRVHLTKEIQIHGDKLKEVASNIADFYWHEPDKTIGRHVDMFNLFRMSGRVTDQTRAFTPKFVMEAYANKRPISELIEQCKDALTMITEIEDWDTVHSFSCAATTLTQLLKSVEWSGGQYEYMPEIPPVLLSEGRVPHHKLWTMRMVRGTLHDALRLVETSELHRAKGLINRWFSNLSPFELIGLFPETDVYEEWSGEKRLTENTREFLQLLGRLNQHVGLMWRERENKSIEEHANEAEILAIFYGGYLIEALELGGKVRWARALKQVKVFLWSDFEFCLSELAKHQRWFEIAYLLKRMSKKPEDCPLSFQIRAGTFSLFTGKTTLIDKWAEPIANNALDYMKSIKDNDFKEHSILFCMVCFIVGYIHPHRENRGISHEGVQQYFKQGRDDRTREHAAILFNASAFTGKLLSVLMRKGNEVAKQIITSGELEQVLTALLESRQPWKAIYDSKEVTKFIVEILIQCTELLGQPFNKMIFDYLKKYSEKYPINYMLEIGWNYLADRGEYELLFDWLSYWCGPTGKIWNQDVANRLDVVNRFSELAYEVGFDLEAKEALERLNWGMVSYTGHKEYSLDRPISWYKGLAGLRPKVWEKEGKRLLEISQEATRVGDNRLAFLVDATVATSVAKCGVSDTWRFFLAQEESIKNNPHILFDGLIEMLESEVVTEEDLFSLWVFGIGVLIWQNGFDRCYLEDLRIVLLSVAESNGIEKFAKKLETLGPSEFNVSGNHDRYHIPKRWFESTSNNERVQGLLLNLDSLPFEKAIEKLYQVYGGTDIYYDSDVWQGVAFLARKLKSERPTGFIKHVNRLLTLVNTRSNSFGWSSDGVYEAYEALIPLIHDRKRMTITKEVISKIDFETEPQIWASVAAENLDYLCLYRAASIGENELSKGLNCILTTHEMWIHGNGFLPEIQRIKLPSFDQFTTFPDSWSQFATHYFHQILKSDNGSKVEVALRGLWAMFEIKPIELDYTMKHWQDLHPRAKEWVLLIAERVAISHPSNFDIFTECVHQCFEGEDIKLKLQAWLVLKGLERSTGRKCPCWSMKKHSQNEKIAASYTKIIPGVLKVPSVQLGSIHSTGGNRTILSTLELLKSITMEDLRDIEQRYASYIRGNPPNKMDFKIVNKRDGEIRLETSAELCRLGDIIYYEMFKGRWGDISLSSLAQALTTGDEPFIFLKTSPLAVDQEDWAIDEKLEKHLGSKAKLIECLLPHIHAGVPDEQFVLGGVLYSYSRKADVKIIYDTSINHPEFVLSKVPRLSTFNGRAFALYNKERFDPQKELGHCVRMTYETGGIGDFVHQSLLSYPSHLWSTLFDWHASPINPTVWLDKNGQIVAKLECFRGPIRDLIQDYNYRQPLLQRWVCSRKAFEDVSAKLGGLVKPSTLIEVDYI
ncbi:ATP-binding protein [Peribacillus simplex]|uniref:ATP-binding protein n=1 Tax=Peribacillus simplex TaxID=1478 RepID=UPI003D2CE239